MLEKLKENMIKLFSAAMEKLAVLGRSDVSDRADREVELRQFSLDELMSCFEGVNKENFLTQKPLENFLQSIVTPDTGGKPSSFPTGFARKIAENEFDIKDLDIPEGTRITFAIFPTTRDGIVLTKEEMDDTKTDDCPYFQLLWSNPKDKSGKALGLGNTWPVPFLKMYPKEVVEEASFVVEYSPLKDRKEGETDYAYFSRMAKEKYAKLREMAMERL